MTGKELKQEKEKVVNYGLTKEEKKITFKCKTCLGDEVIMIFNSPKREEYAAIAEKIWVEYTLLPNHLVYLPPNIYWTIYKKIPLGFEFLKGVGNILEINGEKYYFPKTDFYFSEKVEGTRGVYGIYWEELLIYEGSASDIMSRWHEHDAHFREGRGPNFMYSQGFEPDKIRYEILDDGSDLGINTPSMWIFELIERVYIKLLKPKFNKEGLTTQFNFQAKPNDVPISYWKMLQEYLKTT